MEMEVSEEDNKPSLQADRGLNFLLPLYYFLRNAATDCVYLILVNYFKDSQYIQKNPDFVALGTTECHHEQPATSRIGGCLNRETTLLKFLHHLNTISQKKRLTEYTQKNKKGNIKTNQGQAPQPTQEHNLLKRSKSVQNIKENENILSQVLVKDLLELNYERCQILKNLDLSFIINLITNEVLSYQLQEDVLMAVNSIRTIRNNLFHPRFNFSEDDFIKNLSELMEIMELLYQHLGIPKENLQRIESLCHNQAASGFDAERILEQLRSEIGEKYKAPFNYVSPTIIEKLADNEHLIEDLAKYICEEKSPEKKQPILLCGDPGMGKSIILQHLAYTHKPSYSGENIYSNFSLVLYLDDYGYHTHSSSSGAHNNANISEAFWERVFNSVGRLAHNTVSAYGIESIKAILYTHIDRILFLLNWNQQAWGPLCREMQRGTWCLTHQGYAPSSADWRVFIVKPYAEVQVRQLLKSFSRRYQDDIVLYENCNYKSLLSSPGMVKLFCEMQSSVTFGTELEMVEFYVKKKLPVKDDEKELLKLGEYAHMTIAKPQLVYQESSLGCIRNDVRELFVTYDGRRFHFTHLSVRDYVAAFFVANCPSRACNGWLLKANAFKRVFQFACAIWCQDQSLLREHKHHVKDYLYKLFDVKVPSESNKKGSIEQMEIDGNESKERRKQNKKKKQPAFVNPVKDPFTDWNFFLQLDDVCHGDRKILELFAGMLSKVSYWIIKSNSLTDQALRRLEKVWKKVLLSRNAPLMIKLKSDVEVSGLIRVWNKLKNMENFFHCTKVKIAIEHKGKNSIVGYSAINAELFDMIAHTHCPIYIVSYKGPFICSETPAFLKCECMRKLEVLDVCAYDIVSLIEVLSIEGLRYLREITLTVDLKTSEENLETLKPLHLPKYASLKLTIRYFDKFQTLLNGLTPPRYLRSLNIQRLYIKDNFKLDISSFKNLETLYIRFEEKQEGTPTIPQLSLMASEAMDVDEDELIAADVRPKRLPRHSWAFSVSVSLILPKYLERLLLRNVDFCNDSNNYHFLNLFKKYSIQRLLILDSHLSVRGVRQTLSIQTESMDEDLETMTKKLRMDRSNSNEMQKLVAKLPRLSKEERNERRSRKPSGKEIIITSNRGINDRQIETETQEPLEDLVYLIEDLYRYNVLSFSFTGSTITVRKDVCGDLRLHCYLMDLDDHFISQLGSSTVSNSWLAQLMSMMVLAQYISVVCKSISEFGARGIVNQLKDLKKKCSSDGTVEPFSLTLCTTYHPVAIEAPFTNKFLDDIRGEQCLASFNLFCTCRDKCYHLKKAYSGNVLVNDKMIR